MFYFNASHGNPMKMVIPNVLFGGVVPIIVKIIIFIGTPRCLSQLGI